VWENVILGEEPTKGGLVDRDTARKTVTQLADLLDLDVSPDTEVGPLPLPTRQGIEIIKALRRDARILRFLTFRMEKYAIKYSEKRRSATKEKKEN
jgi:simple sugar transport system ATP-binding protein